MTQIKMLTGNNIGEVEKVVNEYLNTNQNLITVRDIKFSNVISDSTGYRLFIATIIYDK